MNFFVMALTLLLLAASPASAGHAILMLYQVSEPGIDEYQSRILVTPTHVRLDEGPDSNGYTLYDREQDIIYGVSDINRSILVIDPPPARPLPQGLLLKETVVVDEQAPQIAGRRPHNVALLANGRLCNQLVTVPDLLPEAIAALREFHALLARAQQATVDRIPDDQQSDCDLAEFVYAPGRALAHGLPIREQRGKFSRFLVDFSDQALVDNALFVIPADYARMAMPTGR